MIKGLKYLFPWILLLALIAFSLHKQQPPSLETPSPITTFSQNVMTIDYHISIGQVLPTEQKRHVQKIIDSTFNEIHSIYNKWNPSSEISQLNCLKAHEQKVLSPELYNFFLRMDQLVNISEGLFDPTLEPLQQLWKKNLENNKIPTQDEINDLKPALGWDKIHFQNGMFYKEDSRSALDLGGIAKGLGVDLLVERLNQSGFDSVFVEWGGEIRCSGNHPDGRPWKVFIRGIGDPLPDHAIAHLNLINQAIATSGDYFQFWSIKNSEGVIVKYCHIFNPRTLSPVRITQYSIGSASLAAQDCVTADALAKVLMLFDTVEEAEEWAKRVQERFPDVTYWITTRYAPQD